MNKYLLMSAAAALATSAAGTAQASSYSVHFGTADGGSYCDGEIGTATGNVYAGTHHFTACGTTFTNLVTEGLSGKIGTVPGKSKKAVLFSDDTYAYNYHENYAIDFELSSPIKAGKDWALWVNFFGSSSFVGNEGVLLAGQYAKVPGKKAEKSMDKVTALIKASKK
jgi:hypothetical protein